jgi:bifunctional non-homologous end joining protein LigD
MENMMSIDGIELDITNPEKVLWPDLGIKKLEYIEYLLQVAEYLLPYTRKRMLMLWLYPHGLGKRKIEKRSVPQSAPPWLHTIFYKDKNRILLDTKAALVWTAEYGAVEIHVPFDHYERPGYPTELAFDLDPPNSEYFDLVLEVALQLKGILDSLGLMGIPKTSGKSGLQIYVPIDPEYTFEETRKVNKFFANYIAEKMPNKITLDRVVERRGTKLYFDFLQLWSGRTMPAPYSVRATHEATVSTPLTWREIEQGVRPSDFTVLTIPKRLEQNGDLFKRVTTEKSNQPLGEILKFINHNT